MATIDVIKETLVDNIDIDAAAITPDATLDSLNIDSLDLVELICDIEEKLSIDFGEPEGLTTIGQMVEYIDSLQ